ncbi:hypothetical protein DQ04_15911000 [Trypanosoma grayi]|uniref:hypothetical protein n=1 Tax=Trypanosoma grayi TaxID=71804 RepID=UPI0004F3F333|nr:hypothetical protein DQ04_15911000 [Trypanosoma grayi]KEG06105.1 hypothetical protein DQ04_15911000 [Trypanosoma grayi]
MRAGDAALEKVSEAFVEGAVSAAGAESRCKLWCCTCGTAAVARPLCHLTLFNTVVPVVVCTALTGAAGGSAPAPFGRGADGYLPLRPAVHAE